jgi:hypothetical protein
MMLERQCQCVISSSARWGIWPLQRASSPVSVSDNFQTALGSSGESKIAGSLIATFLIFPAHADANKRPPSGRGFDSPCRFSILEHMNSRLTGKIVQISKSASGSTIVFIIVDKLKGVVRRGKFFGHQNDFTEPTASLQVGDFVTFEPSAPNRKGQLPHAKTITISRV